MAGEKGSYNLGFNNAGFTFGTSHSPRGNHMHSVIPEGIGVMPTYEQIVDIDRSTSGGHYRNPELIARQELGQQDAQRAHGLAIQGYTNGNSWNF